MPAGSYRKSMDETTEADFDAIIALNAKGPYFAMQAAARVLRDGGRIVNISTALTHLNFPGATAHLGSKAALEQYGKGLAQELAPRGITVNTVLPGFTDTGVLTEHIRHVGIQMSPLKRLGLPTDIADVVAFLVSEQAAVADRSNDSCRRWHRHVTARGGYMTRRNVSTGGPWEGKIGYSRAVRVGQSVQVSGTTAMTAGGTRRQRRSLCANHSSLKTIEAALAQAGASMTDVVRTRIYMADIEQWQEVGRAHGEVFGAIRPATTMVEVKRLIDPDMLVEIEADAITAEANPHA